MLILRRLPSITPIAVPGITISTGRFRWRLAAAALEAMVYLEVFFHSLFRVAKKKVVTQCLGILH
jgi:hypothetical protein